MTSTAVSVTGLTKRYGARTAVDHLDIEVPTGVVAGFVGPTAPARPRRWPCCSASSARLPGRARCWARRSSVRPSTCRA